MRPYILSRIDESAVTIRHFLSYLQFSGHKNVYEYVSVPPQFLSQHVNVRSRAEYPSAVRPTAIVDAMADGTRAGPEKSPVGNIIGQSPDVYSGGYRSRTDDLLRARQAL